MDPNSSLGKIYLGENVVEISSDKIEGFRDWDSLEYQDTTNSGGKKETKAMVIYKMDTEEVSDRFVEPCFVNGLEAYNGHDLERIRNDIPLLGGEELQPFVCKMGKSGRNKKRAMENLNLFYQYIGTSLSTGRHLTQEEAANEALELRISQKFALLEEVRPVLETMDYHDKYKKVLDEIWKDKVELDGMIMKEEEEAIKTVKGEALKEKDDPGAFIFLIRLEGQVKENKEKNKIGSKPDKNGKCGEAGRSQKKLHLKEEEKPKKTKKEWPDLYKLLLVQVMATPVIPISSYSSEESMGSYVPRVILFGTIPTSIHVILVVPAEVPIAPADPIVAPKLPLVLPFLCSDDSEADNKSELTKQRPERHESLTPSSKFPLAPVIAPPGIRRRPAILVRPGEAIPFGRPYRTHPNGPRKLLIARNKVRPFPAHRLAWRHVSHCSLDRHCLPDFTSDSSFSSSSSDSPSDISLGSSSDLLSNSSSVYSLGCDASGQSHSGPSTRVASPRWVDPLDRTLRCSEVFMRLRSASLSTLYPPTTSESSLDLSSERSLDSSSPSAGPSRKRCRSLTTLVPSSIPVLRLIALALTDLPPRKRFKYSYSSEASRKEHMEIGTADAETVVDLGVSDRVRAPTEDGLGMGVEVDTSDIREDEKEFEAEASTGGMMEIAVDPLVTGGIFEPTKGDAPDLEEAGQLVASGERGGLANRVSSLGRENLRVRDLLCIERDHVDSLCHHMALSQEEFHQIRRDRDNTRRRLRSLESLVERHLGFCC
uniref:Uncharacterized protein n=1 Tax=Tanacetum cinerariifolium TaxID=118510 RepID=A0A6L2P6G9_TANCI|nr:hypothetical protein [Tanacetum cinerariifolium]